MFTGIVQAVGLVRTVEPRGRLVRLEIDPNADTATAHSPTPWAHRPAVGDSIAVNGCCLTVAQSPGAHILLAFDVVPETLAKTALGGLTPGSRVNLEHAATLASYLDGHVVQGHVDGVAIIESVRTGDDWRVRLRPPAGLMEFLVPKGSVALDGVSLTIADLDPAPRPNGAGLAGAAGGWFEVALIPTTLAKTTLGAWSPGDRVNLECDAMAKTVVHWLRHFGEAGRTIRP